MYIEACGQRIPLYIVGKYTWPIHPVDASNTVWTEPESPQPLCWLTRRVHSYLGGPKIYFLTERLLFVYNLWVFINVQTPLLFRVFSPARVALLFFAPSLRGSGYVWPPVWDARSCSSSSGVSLLPGVTDNILPLSEMFAFPFYHTVIIRPSLIRLSPVYTIRVTRSALIFHNNGRRQCNAREGSRRRLMTCLKGVFRFYGNEA